MRPSAFDAFNYLPSLFGNIGTFHSLKVHYAQLQVPVLHGGPVPIHRRRHRARRQQLLRRDVRPATDSASLSSTSPYPRDV